MNERERKALAEQILTNPLFPIVMDQLEKNAMEQAIHAEWHDDRKRADALAQVRATRDFRRNLEAALRDNSPRNGSFA